MADAIGVETGFGCLKDPQRPLGDIRGDEYSKNSSVKVRKKESQVLDTENENCKDKKEQQINKVPGSVVVIVICRSNKIK